MIHILIVEDDKELNRTVCRHLSAHNYLTVGVLRAEEAFDQLYAGHFDLVISDIMMPCRGWMVLNLRKQCADRIKIFQSCS